LNPQLQQRPLFSSLQESAVVVGTVRREGRWITKKKKLIKWMISFYSIKKNDEENENVRARKKIEKKNLWI